MKKEDICMLRIEALEDYIRHQENEKTAKTINYSYMLSGCLIGILLMAIPFAMLCGV